jgi:hypothetical protein
MNAGRLEVLDEIYTPRMAAAARAWIVSMAGRVRSGTES